MNMDKSPGESDPTPRYLRRSFLRNASVAGAVGIAGCGGKNVDRTTSDYKQPTEEPDSQSTEEPEKTPTERESSSSLPPSIESLDVQATNMGELRISVVATSENGLKKIEFETTDGQRTVDIDGVANLEDSWVVEAERGAFHNAKVTVVDTKDQQSRAETNKKYVPLKNRLVLSPYYTWYDDNRWEQGHASTPELGLYNSRDPRICDEHLAWASEYGIDAFVVSWWGPDNENTVDFENGILSREWPSDVEYCILYEPYGPTGGLLEYGDNGCDLSDSSNQAALNEHFSYIAENYATDPNYLRIDDRPVVYFWIANSLIGDVETAFQEATSAAGIDPYLIADIPFWNAPLLAGTELANTFDAVTDYIAFAPEDFRDGTDIDLDAFLREYSEATRRWQLAAHNADLDFFPVVQPGYTSYGDSVNSVHPRDHELFRDICNRALERVDPGLEGVVVTSFNEWHEDSHVEPDTEVGVETLDVVKSHVASGDPAPEKPGQNTLVFDFEKTARPSDVQGSEDTRELAFACSELLCLDDNNKTVAKFDIGGDEEPLLIDGVFGPGEHQSRTWRWMGGPAARSVLSLEEDLVSATASIVVDGRAYIDVETSFQLGDRSGTVELTEGWDTYQVFLE